MISLESFAFAAVYGCAIVAAWLLTYAVHSTCVLGAIWAADTLQLPNPRQREVLWKIGLLGGVVTATVAVSVGVTPWAGRYEAGALIEASWSNAPAISWPLRVVPLATVAAWAVYAAAILTKVAYVTLEARRRLGTRTPSDAATRDIVRDVGQSLGIDYHGLVTVSDSSSSPAVLGRSEITLPRRVVTEFSRDEQRSIIAHELAHVLRRDPWWLIIAATIEAMFFFQRLNRTARSKWQDASEDVCDDLAVRTAGERLALARSLARMAEWPEAEPPPLLAPAFAEQRATLLRRVRRILEFDVERTAPSNRVTVLSAIALLVLATTTAPAFSAGSVRGWGAPAFMWEGVIPPGRVIEIHGVMGSVHAVPTTADLATVRATRHGRSTNPDVRFEVVNSDRGVTICALYPTPIGIDANQCVPGAGEQNNTRDNDLQVEFLVSVPAGVGLVVASSTGDITSEALSGPVSATTSSGNINVRLTTANWTGAQTLSSKSGNVVVTLPKLSDVEIDAATTTGTIRAGVAIGAPPVSWLDRLKMRGSLGGRARGVLGRGGRQLVIRTIAGNIAIHVT